MTPGKQHRTSADKISDSRRGAAAVEAAITLGLVTFLAIGAIEYGRALMVNQIIVNAAREGARHAAKPNASDARVNQILDTYMATNGIASTDYSKSVSISYNGTQRPDLTVSTAPSKSDITVQVAVLNSEASWGFMSLIAGGRQFAAEVDIRKE